MSAAVVCSARHPALISTGGRTLSRTNSSLTCFVVVVLRHSVLMRGHHRNCLEAQHHLTCRNQGSWDFSQQAVFNAVCSSIRSSSKTISKAAHLKSGKSASHPPQNSNFKFISLRIPLLTYAFSQWFLSSSKFLQVPSLS